MKSHGWPPKPCRYTTAGCAEYALPKSRVCQAHRDSERKLRALRASFAVKQNMICPYCDQPLPADLYDTHIDHIIPVQHGGPDDLWNIQLLHGACNIAKGGLMTPAAFEVAKAQGINVWSLGFNSPFEW